MRMISVKFQNIIKWVPLFNAFIVFFYVYNTYARDWKGLRFLKGVIKMFLSAIIPTIFYRIINLLPLTGLWADISNILYIYLMCLII